MEREIEPYIENTLYRYILNTINLYDANDKEYKEKVKIAMEKIIEEFIKEYSNKFYMTKNEVKSILTRTMQGDSYDVKIAREILQSIDMMNENEKLEAKVKDTIYDSVNIKRKRNDEKGENQEIEDFCKENPIYTPEDVIAAIERISVDKYIQEHKYDDFGER